MTTNLHVLEKRSPGGVGVFAFWDGGLLQGGDARQGDHEGSPVQWNGWRRGKGSVEERAGRSFTVTLLDFRIISQALV